MDPVACKAERVEKDQEIGERPDTQRMAAMVERAPRTPRVPARVPAALAARVVNVNRAKRLAGTAWTASMVGC